MKANDLEAMERHGDPFQTEQDKLDANNELWGLSSLASIQNQPLADWVTDVAKDLGLDISGASPGGIPTTQGTTIAAPAKDNTLLLLVGAALLYFIFFHD